MASLTHHLIIFSGFLRFFVPPLRPPTLPFASRLWALLLYYFIKINGPAHDGMMRWSRWGIESCDCGRWLLLLSLLVLIVCFAPSLTSSDLSHLSHLLCLLYIFYPRALSLSTLPVRALYFGLATWVPICCSRLFFVCIRPSFLSLSLWTFIPWRRQNANDRSYEKFNFSTH